MMDSNLSEIDMAVDSEELRRVMRQWATGVTVVAAQYKDVRHGMTVNAFTSVTLTPPLVLVSLERITRTRNLVEKAGHFGVSILDASQQNISEQFAGNLEEYEDRFTNVPTFTLESGAPFIVGGIAFLDCRVTAQHEVGTHTLFIGEVLDVRNEIESQSSEQVEGQPLIYYQRAYRRLQL
jgi:flavin reductase (DIM6/NTAB) family NADH-FMN oxidoreductase RutF